MKLVVATRNAGKKRELAALLAPLGYELVTLDEAGVEGEVEETGDTFVENAELKARAALDATGLATLADDSGLEVDALGGAPGVHSARYAGVAHDEQANNARLLRELVGVEDRTARFRCTLVYLEPGGRRVVVDGACEGRIGTEPRGANGFGYDPLFLLRTSGYERTMAELSADEKNRSSHRADALAKLVAALRAG
ncbi:MAG: XTP/dITP diphosphatase [Polyangia bacterium]